MPKEKTKNKKGNKKSSSEKDDMLKELAIKLKLAEKSSEENADKDEEKAESDLEKDVELNLDNFEFHDFMSSDDSSAPALERIAGRQSGPVFVGGIPRSSQTITGEEKESDPFKYMPGGNANGEPKYIESDSHITAVTERVDFNRLGRNVEPWSNINQEAMFTQSSEARTESSSQERRWNPGRFDERERKNHGDERDDAKYDKYKPDLPKSR
jgi:hypothetical protein